VADLRLDLAALDAAADRLDALRAGLALMPTDLRDAAELTGHRALGIRLAEFADSLDRSRWALAARLEALAGALRAISATFGRLDAAMADESGGRP